MRDRRGPWRRRLRVGIWVALVLGFPTFVLPAAVDPELAARGWRPLLFEDKRPNEFRAGTGDAIEVISNGGVSLLERSISVDLGATPILTWRWRVAVGVPPTDLARAGQDDRSLAVYVSFPFRPEEASWFERMRRGLVEMLAGRDAPGRVLNYVWGGEGDPGTVVESPYYGDSGQLIILRSARTTSGPWHVERIDVAADYRAAFGTAPPDPSHIAIGADSDDTGTMIHGWIEGLRFVPR